MLRKSRKKMKSPSTVGTLSIVWPMKICIRKGGYDEQEGISTSKVTLSDTDEKSILIAGRIATALMPFREKTRP